MSPLEELRAEMELLAKAANEWEQVAYKQRRALEFYADPETYFAIAFLADPPCGPFMEDGELFDMNMKPCDEDTPYARWRPGKKAREALAREKRNG